MLQPSLRLGDPEVVVQWRQQHLTNSARSSSFVDRPPVGAMRHRLLL
jgi:hypothetical protein